MQYNFINRREMETASVVTLSLIHNTEWNSNSMYFSNPIQYNVINRREIETAFVVTFCLIQNTDLNSESTYLFKYNPIKLYQSTRNENCF